MGRGTKSIGFLGTCDDLKWTHTRGPIQRTVIREFCLSMGNNVSQVEVCSPTKQPGQNRLASPMRCVRHIGERR